MELSTKRIGRLLNVELKTWGLPVLIIATCLLFMGVTQYFVNGSMLYGDEAAPFDTAGFYPGVALIFFFLFLLIAHRRVNKSTPLPYTILPASTIEKYISLLITALACFLLAALTAELAYLVVAIIKPASYSAPNLHSSAFYIGSFQVVNPFLFKSSFTLFIQVFSVYCLSFSFILFTAISFRKLRSAAGLYISILIATTLVLSQFGQFYFSYYNSREDQISLGIQINADTIETIMTSLAYLFSVGFLILSYYKLKRKQI